MLWDLIRDFYVQYLFGGITSDGSFYYGSSGSINFANEVGDYGNVGFDTAFPILVVGKGYYGDVFYGGEDITSPFTLTMSLGDWLSTTATIITMCVFVVLLFLLVRWVFKLCAGLFTLRG